MKKLVLFMFMILVVTGCSNQQQDKENTLLKEMNETLLQKEALLEEKIKALEEKNQGMVSSIDEATQLISEMMEELKVLKNTDNPAKDDVDELLSFGPVIGAPLLLEATNIVVALQANDMATLQSYVHPVDGLRLSPYQYVDIANDILLTPSEVGSLFSLPTLYHWGDYDGSGDPIDLLASNYYNAFIYDEDYLMAPYIGQNTILSSGNMINNITTAYSGESFVEFYFSGFNPIYEGIDWKSLTLVMKNSGGYWYLVGIVHGQWTI